MNNLLNLKGGLAFFLVCVAAFMTILWMLYPPTGDASQIGLLAGFVTLFIKMAADAVGYQYNSSSGSEKKDEVQAVVAGKLADKVPGAPGALPVPPWWSRLTDIEKNAITAAGPTDPRTAAFITASQNGAAGRDDLEYLVSKSLIAPDRVSIISAT